MLTFVAGPRTPNIIEVTRSGNISAVQFTTTVGNTYSVAYTNQLGAATTTWPVDATTLIGDGKTDTLNHTNSGDRGGILPRERTINQRTNLLNTAVVGAEVKNGAIKRVQAENQAAEAHFCISARVFVDCTGDGRLGVEAGAPYRQGREGRADSSRSIWRRPKATATHLAPPCCFRRGSTTA